MRIAHLSLHPTRPGEAPATHVTEISAGLCRLGHRVDAFQAGRADGPLSRLREARTLQQDAVAAAPDVLYVRQHVLGNRACRLARRHGIPVVLEVNAAGASVEPGGSAPHETLSQPIFGLALALVGVSRSSVFVPPSAASVHYPSPITTTVRLASALRG